MIRRKRPSIDVSIRAAIAASVLAFLASGVPRAQAQLPFGETQDTIAYSVRQNDTLYDLAATYLADPQNWTVLQRINRVADPKRLQPGSTLRIPATLLKRSQPGAKTIAVRGLVERASYRGPYGLLMVDTTLAEGDVVRTQARSFATIELSDGSHVTLMPNTSLDIQRLRTSAATGGADRKFSLEKGEVRATVTPLKPRDQFNISTPSVIAGVRGTEFGVGYDAGESIVEVLAGKVAVDGKDASQALVPMQFGVVADPTGHVDAPVQLLAAPALAHPGDVQAGSSIAFDIVPVTNARTYRVTIASDAGFLDMLDTVRADGPRAVFADLPDGNYFVRLSAIDAHGLEGLTRIYSLRRARTAATDVAPQQAATHYEFRWTDDVDASSLHTSHFVLAADPQLHDPLVDQAGLTGTRLMLSDLKPGKYFWRVAVARRAADGGIDERSTPVQSFTVGR